MQRHASKKAQLLRCSMLDVALVVRCETSALGVQALRRLAFELFSKHAGPGFIFRYNYNIPEPQFSIFEVTLLQLHIETPCI